MAQEIEYLWKQIGMLLNIDSELQETDFESLTTC